MHMERDSVMEAIRRRLEKEEPVKAVCSSEKEIAGQPRVFINGAEVPEEEVAKTLFNLLED